MADGGQLSATGTNSEQLRPLQSAEQLRERLDRSPEPNPAAPWCPWATRSDPQASPKQLELAVGENLALAEVCEIVKRRGTVGL